LVKTEKKKKGGENAMGRDNNLLMKAPRGEKQERGISVGKGGASPSGHKAPANLKSQVKGGP